MLSVIIVSYNVKYYLEQCLHSLLAAHFSKELEIIVVDNNSHDGSIPYLKSKFPNVKFIANTQNLGFSKANNIAIKESKGAYVLLLNPDTVVGEQVLSEVYNFMEQHPESGAAGVKMIDGTGTFLPESKRGFPSPWVSFCKMSGLSKIFPYSSLFGKYHLRYLDEDKTHKVDVLAGAFMFIRRETLEKVGLLDERFFMYGEDIDLSYRIKKGGYENYYLPQRILHYKGESAHENEVRYIKIFYGAMYLFFKKHFPHYSFIYAFLIRLGIFFGGSCAFLGKLTQKLFAPFLPQKQTYTFSTVNHSWEDIINQMDIYKGKKKNFLIYSHESGCVIGSNFVKNA